MITLTPQAATKIKVLCGQEEKAEPALRLFVAGGGCSGFQYGMTLDAETADGDQIIEHDGVKLVVDEFSITMLTGAEVDYVETIMNSGFTVRNPNAVSSCACGHSFKAADVPGNPNPCH